MTVENIIKKIDADVKQKIKNIYQRQKEAEEELVGNVQMEKERRVEEIRKQKEKEIKVLTNRMISQARLKKRKKVLAVRERIMEEVLQNALDQIGDMEPGDYISYLRQAIGKMSSTLDGKVTIRCNSKSENVVRELSKKIDPELTIEADLDCIGGVMGVSEDGSTIDLTMETNLERNSKTLRKDICKIMFTEEG